MGVNRLSFWENRWQDFSYRQIKGAGSALVQFADNSFDCVICHNVLECTDEKQEIVRQLCHVLKPNGFISVVKLKQNGRAMQMAVLLDDFAQGNALLDGSDGSVTKYGQIRYYEDENLTEWTPRFTN